MPIPKNRVNQASYLDCVKDLLSTRQVASMRQWRHHFSVTTYDHSLFVSYVAFRLGLPDGRPHGPAPRSVSV